MKITETSKQQAGECADALRKIVPCDLVDEDGDPVFSVRDQLLLGDLLLALEDAERGTPAKTTDEALRNMARGITGG